MASERGIRNNGAAATPRSTSTATTDARPQVRPTTEGWQQKLGPDGRPVLQFAEPKRGKPPVHLADLTPEQRTARVIELGLPGFRAKQLSTHYFTHCTTDPARMTDLPAAQRDELALRLAELSRGQVLLQVP